MVLEESKKLFIGYNILILVNIFLDSLFHFSFCERIVYQNNVFVHGSKKNTKCMENSSTTILFLK